MKKFGDLIIKYLSKNWWYCILLLFSSLYVFCYRKEIYQLTDLNARNLIFILWLVLLVLPLLSEVEILGVKIKKEIEDVKSEIKSLGYQITDLKLSNNNSVTTYNYQGPLPPIEGIKEYIPKGEFKYNRIDLNKDIENLTSDVSQQAVYLFQIRFILEKLMLSLSEKVGYNGLPVMHKMLPIVCEHDLISNEDVELINKIYRITSRGIHGEIISNDYIEFVRNVYPEVHNRLIKALDGKPKEAYHQYNINEY